MAFSRPTLTQIQARIQADMLARIGGTSPALRRGVLGVLATVIGGVAHALYGAVQYFSRQAVPGTADAQDLERWASLWGLSRRQPTAATGSVVISGEVGATVAANSRVQSLSGIEYRFPSAVTIGGGGTAVGAVIALTFGSAGNQLAGVTLSFVSPPIGVDPTCMVDSAGLNAGQDLESDDSLRARLVDRVSNPPQGGSAADYVRWALGVAGVTRAWVAPLYDGPGTVQVWIADDAYTGTPRVAASTLVTAAQTALDALRPVTADLTVQAPLRQAQNFTIALTPNTAEVRAAVQANLRELLLAEAAPEGTVLISHIREAISTATGERNHVLSVPTTDITAATGAILTLGTITWL